MTCPARSLRALLRRLAASTSGVAMLEFAFVLPIVVLMSLTGAELTNYITVKMRVSQLALTIADNAARMGNGSMLSAKTISESDINDVFAGAQLESGGLDLQANGRVILSDVEPVATPNTSARYKIRWKRCFGAKKSYVPLYPRSGQNVTSMTGMGPVGREVTAQDDNATLFVEVYFVYKPLLKASWAPTATLTETASMAVRDRRDLTDDSATTNLHPNGVYKVSGVTASTC